MSWPLVATNCASGLTAAAADSSNASAEGAWSAFVLNATVPPGSVTFVPGTPVTAPPLGRALVQ